MPTSATARRRLFADLSPPAMFVLSFLALILIGTVGLMTLPGLYTGPGLGPLHALFTMTSAVCVTGLTVVDTATYFTRWGQAWILLFIQLGGLGLITLTSIIIGAMGRRLSLRTEMIAVATPNGGREYEIWELALAVTRFTLVVEAVGAAILFLLWVQTMPASEAIWHAVFQAVSAFCNAGFSTFSDSLVGWQRSPLVLLTMSFLIIIGGIGFYTINELLHWWRANVGRGRGPRRISSHTFAAVATTLALLVAGTLFFVIFEWDDCLAGMSVGHRIVNAWFMSVTARTAGFNSVSYTEIGNDAAFFTIMLMFVGGTPGSTAGGLKTTTLAVLVTLAWSRLRGRRVVELHGRGVPEDTLERTVSLTLLAAAVLTVAVLLLNAIQQTAAGHLAARVEFLPIVFEAVSAFGTVGLSMGMTSRMPELGQAVIILLMFVGRVGLFSFFAAVTLNRGKPRVMVRPAQEDLLVG